jgi:hemolysin secretion/activation protein ShlB/FhaC/HecB
MVLFPRPRFGAFGHLVRRWRGGLPLWFLSVLLGFFVFGSVARGDNQSLLEGRSDLTNSADQDALGPVMWIDRVVVRYAPQASVLGDILPPLSDVANLQIELGTIQRRDGVAYIGSTQRYDLAQGEITRVSLGDMDTLSEHRYTTSAIRSISGQITTFMNSYGLAGIYVQPDAQDIAAAEAPEAARKPVVLHFTVHVAIVKQVRTVEIGSQAPSNDTDKINNKLDEPIIENSPVQAEYSPWQAGGQEVIRKGDLDDYLLYLNRTPGRQVNASIDYAQQADSVSMDYLVARDNPWSGYFQIGNTGTKETNEWQESVGVTNTDLTGHDDVLNLNYTTAGFSNQNEIDLSYDTPFFDWSRTRAKVYTSYDEFDSSDLGDSSIHFTGNTYLLGGEVSQNVYQHHHLFIDLLAGLKVEGIHVDNSTSDIGGTGYFALPYIGMHLERNTLTASIVNDATLLGSFTTASKTTRDALGRVNTDPYAPILQDNYTASFFLEPLLFPSDFAAQRSTLANELAFSVKGQYAFSQRLVAEQEYVAGGLYTVRGYPESIVAGDSAAIGSMEYRFHIPRALGISSEPGELFGDPFRWQPQQPYGRPDWDLIVLGFLDGGEVLNSRREPFETNAALLSVGVGADLQFKDNADLRLDWGTALNPVTDAQTGEVLAKRGSSRLSMVLTLKI